MERVMNRDSNIDEIKRELELLKIAHEALLKSHRDLALKALGDTPETALFLGQIEDYTVEHYPEWLKS
jgi:hypothetical protein